MKLLHVTASYWPAVRYGGLIVSVHALCRALAERGHDVHVYTTSVNGDRDSDVAHDKPVDIEGVHVWYFRSPRFRRVYWAPRLRARLRAHVREFDIVHTHAIYLWPLWTAAHCARENDVPYVVSPRGMLEKALIEQKSTMWKAALIGFIEKRTLERAAAVHVTSAREAGEIGAFGFDLPRVCTIPNGVSIDAPASARVSAGISEIAAGEPFVLFLGRVNWKKGLDRLIAALPRVEGVRLVIAGNDEEEHTLLLDDLARQAGVGDRVIFTGPVYGADKVALLTSARALALPSYSENFGNVVLEAMALGTPVVVTPEVGVADVVRETGAGIVADGNASSLAQALDRLSKDAGLRQEMGRRGRAVAHERFGWPAVAESMEQLYQSIVEGRRPC